MKGARYPASIPFLDSHNRCSIQGTIGTTKNIKKEDDKLIAKNVFATTDTGEQAWTLTKEGHLKSNSIGYRVEKYTDIPPGEKQDVQGKEYTAPKDMTLRISTKWHVVENSAVIIPADAGAKNREATEGQKPQHSTRYWKEQIMNAKFKEWLDERGIDIESLNEAQRAALEEDFKAIGKAPEGTPDNSDADGQRTEPSEADNIVTKANERHEIEQATLKAEQERVEAIRELGKPDIPDEVIESCIRERKTIEQAQGIFLAVIKNTRKAINAPAIQIRDAAIEKDDIVAGLLMRAGYDELVAKEYGEQRADTANRLRDLCLHDLCVRSIAMDGKPVPMGRDDMIRTAFASLTLPYILGAVANKSALVGYRSAPATWRKWCSIGSVSNFQTQNRVRLTDRGELEQVNNAGEVVAGTATEEQEEFNAETYATTFPITRQNVINDDLGAFTRTPQKMGVKAALLVSKLVYTHLLANGNMGDSAALFVSGHANLNTSTALAEAGLSTALTAFLQQTDADSQVIDVTPRFLLVPPELKVTARQLMESELRLYGADDETTVMAKNVFKGELEVVTEVRLSNSGYTGYSATTWYLAGSPSEVDTIEVAFLNGKQEPTIEKFDADPSTLGIIYRIYLDVGVKALDWRGMSKNTA